MKKSNLLLSLALLALVGCGSTTTSSSPVANSTPATSSSEVVTSSSEAATPVVLHGEYTETFGRNQDEYTTKVDVTVLEDTIVKVEMSEDSNHYTKESTKWAETMWTEYEADVLKSFEGKSVSAILAAESNTVFEAVGGATVTSNRIYQAVLNALQSK